MAEQKFKQAAKLIIKLVVTGACLWYVSTKIDWTTTFSLLEKADVAWLILATIFFIISKIISSVRLNIYFKVIDLHLPEKNNLYLYWLGMFYNLFLPGGIGGDAYKVIVLNKRYELSVKKLSAAVLLDRISGVIGLCILAAAYFYLSSHTTFSIVGMIAVIPGVFFLKFILQKFFPSFDPIFFSTLLPGVAVQVAQVISVYCIMRSIGIPLNEHAYLFIFLISSIVAILPFTIGGLGAREVVFLWGSQQFLLDQHQSIYISILFYIITVITSAVGTIWIFNDPLKNVERRQEL